MKIYDATRPGKPIVGQAEQNRLRQDNAFQGIFSRATLEDLLNQPTCVGLRFYNAGGLSLEQRQLIAVAVAEDGSELRRNSGKGYFISSNVDGVPAEKQTKAQATLAVRATQSSRIEADKKRFQFSSFFSKSAIGNLLSAGVTGIRFFIVPLESTTFQTHLGVSVIPVGQGNPSEVPIHLVSDNPCPGAPNGCAVLERVAAPGASLESTSAAPAQLDTTKYLVIW